MKKQTFVLSILTAGLIAVPTFTARAQGCCGSGMGAMPGMDMSGHDSSPAQPTAVANNLPQSAAAVFNNYARIQTALANDSLESVTASAQAIAKAVNDDAMTPFSKNLVKQAGAVANAADLQAAREAFKPLSKSLIEYVSKNPSLAGTYRQVYCSMANADWLQTDSVVNNPYLGKSMAHCGQFVKSSSNEKSRQQDNSMPGMKM